MFHFLLPDLYLRRYCAKSESILFMGKRKYEVFPCELDEEIEAPWTECQNYELILDLQFWI